MESSMKKIFLLAAMGAAFAGVSHAQTDSNAVDHAQARPASSVKAEVTTVTATTVQEGAAVVESMSVSEPVAVVNEVSPEAGLPAAEFVDASMDLERSMKTMGRNFKAINQAKDVLAMSKEVDELAVYASQSEAIGVDPDKASDEAKAEYVRLMQKLRVQIADLQKAIEEKDGEKAKALVEAINETRKEGHKYFDV